MEDNKMTIQINAGTIFKIMVVVGIVALCYVLKDIVLVVLTSVIMASAIDPGVRWFERRKIPRALGVIFIYLGLAFVALGVLLFLVPTFLYETSSVVENIPKYVEQVGNIIPLLDQSFLQGYSPLLKQISTQISTINFSGITGLAGNAESNIFENASNIISSSLNIILIIVLSFYFSVTRDGVEHFLRIITPVSKEKYVLDLWARSKAKIGGWLQGQLLLGILIGTLLYPALAIFGVKHALLLSILAAVLEIIPVFGATLAAVPAILLALLDGGAGLALIVLGYYVIVQQFESHIFYPLVVKKIIGISPLIVIISLVVGAKLAGVLGMILAVPLSVILVEYLEDLDKRKTARQA